MHTCIAAELYLLLPAELTPSQARSSLPPSHPLLQNSRPVATAAALNTSAKVPHMDCTSAASQPMNSTHKAAHANELMRDTDGSQAAVVATAAATAQSTDGIGIASQSSRGSSQMSIAAAASGVVTRLMKTGSDYVSGVTQQLASDGSHAGHTQLSEREEADPAHLGKARDQAGTGPSTGPVGPEEARGEGNSRPHQVVSCAHSPARQAGEGLPDVDMADGSMADDDVIIEQAVAADPAVVTMTTAVPEAQNRLVSYLLSMQSSNCSATRSGSQAQLTVILQSKQWLNACHRTAVWHVAGSECHAASAAACKPRCLSSVMAF